MLVYRSMTFHKFRTAMIQPVRTTAMVMILLVNLGPGLCTPPVGFYLFVGCAVGTLPMEQAV